MVLSDEAGTGVGRARPCKARASRGYGCDVARLEVEFGARHIEHDGQTYVFSAPRPGEVK